MGDKCLQWTPWHSLAQASLPLPLTMPSLSHRFKWRDDPSLPKIVLNFLGKSSLFFSTDTVKLVGCKPGGAGVHSTSRTCLRMKPGKEESRRETSLTLLPSVPGSSLLPAFTCISKPPLCLNPFLSLAPQRGLMNISNPLCCDRKKRMKIRTLEKNRANFSHFLQPLRNKALDTLREAG